MTVETFTALLETHLTRRPFRPFVIELTDGLRYEVDRSHVLAHRGGRVALILPGPAPATFDSDAVARIVAPADAEG